MAKDGKEKLLPNRFAARCAFCRCRVIPGAGRIWRDTECNTWCVAHEVCLSASEARLIRCVYRNSAKRFAGFTIHEARQCTAHSVERINNVPLCSGHANTVVESRARRGAMSVREPVAP